MWNLDEKDNTVKSMILPTELEMNLLSAIRALQYTLSTGEYVSPVPELRNLLDITSQMYGETIDMRFERPYGDFLDFANEYRKLFEAGIFDETTIKRFRYHAFIWLIVTEEIYE